MGKFIYIQIYMYIYICIYIHLYMCMLYTHTHHIFTTFPDTLSVIFILWSPSIFLTLLVKAPIFSFGSFIFSFLLFPFPRDLIIYVFECNACMYAWMPEESRVSHYRWLWAAMWFLGIELMSSAGTDSVLNALNH